MTTKLNQVVALEKGIKTRTYQTFVAAQQTIQKQAQLSGISRTYKPKDDDGDTLPSESTRVQINVGEVLDDIEAALTRFFDITLTKDVANGEAVADITVDNFTVATSVPVTFLLFLEKQLSELNAFILKLPVLDPSETWTYDDTTAVYATRPSQTIRSKKVFRNHVKAEATEKHPAQVEVFSEDIPVGYWTTVKFSGALPQSRINTLKARMIKLQEAVKIARETANAIPITDRKIGESIFTYLFED